MCETKDLWPSASVLHVIARDPGCLSLAKQVGFVANLYQNVRAETLKG